MKRNRFLPAALSLCLAAALSTGVLAADRTEEETDSAYLSEQGIMVGDQNGSMNLDSSLTRAELAAILTRLNGNLEHIEAEQHYYRNRCVFPDVPEWAKLYVGYCNVHGLMKGYDNGRFGSGDPVTPAAACTVLLRYSEFAGQTWDYSTACQRAVELGLADNSMLQAATISRGDLAVMIFRAQGSPEMETPDTPISNGLSKNSDGSINIPSDGSLYVPQVGDVIRCDDGTNYTITDVSRYDKNMFASGPVGPLPTPLYDWSQFPEVPLPAVQVNHFQGVTGDRLYVLNLYETRRMLYTLYNTVPSCPELWENGSLKRESDGTPVARFSMGIADSAHAQVFWPWRADQLTALLKSAPYATFEVEAWDVYKDGIFQYIEYRVRGS